MDQCFFPDTSTPDEQANASSKNSRPIQNVDELPTDKKYFNI